ncbi:MAG: hypothetical protein HRF44_05540 [Ignavibacterium sp.]|jgi:uncharacterized membrane protein SirB2
MSGSYVFLLHLIGFSFVSALIIAGWILNGRLIAEQDPALKLYLGRIIKGLGLLSPIAAAILLITGIGNIYNLYGDTGIEWYTQGWLVVKIILFGILVVNGMLFGPALSKKRMKIVQSMLEEGETEERSNTLAQLNAQIRWFYVVQAVLLLGVLFFSAFGTSKHPGYF